MAANVEATRRFSTADARALPRFEEDLAELVQAVLPSFNWTAPDPRVRSLSDLAALAKWARIGLRQRKRLADLAYLFSTSANQFLSERFESDHVKAAFGWHAINDSVAGPSTAGHRVRVAARSRERGGRGRRATVGVRARRHGRAHRDDGRRRARGGMRDPHATPRSSGCSRRDGRAVGRSARRRRGAARADGVLSNADPKRTFLSLCDRADLPDEFVARIEAYRCMGTSIKINLAVSELPYVQGLPEGGVQPYHTGIMELNPFIADMDFQQAQAVQGIAADPAHIEVCFPTVHDPSLAPEGKHIMTIDVNSQPYALRDGGAGTTSRRTARTAASRRSPSTSRSCPI